MQPQKKKKNKNKRETVHGQNMLHGGKPAAPM